jgi:hypothetical protein
MDTAYAWRYFPWYAGAAWLGMDGGIVTAYCGWPAGVPMLGAGVIVAGLATRALLRCRRTPEAALRAELLALAATREGTADGWVNRDAHLMFGVCRNGPRWLRTWHVSRADEDIARELHATGRVAATADVFGLLPVSTDITRYTGGAVITATDDGGVEVSDIGPERRGGRVRRAVRVLRRQRQARKAGLLHASPDELRELIDGFREAEPVTAVGLGGEE